MSAPLSKEALTPEEIENVGEYWTQAVQAIQDTRRASITILQRRLRIGYFKALSIIKTMEKYGMVGPENGSSPREIFFT